MTAYMRRFMADGVSQDMFDVPEVLEFYFEKHVC